MTPVQISTSVRISGVTTVSAREVHKALATYPGGFTGWIGYRLKKHKLIEGVDYVTSVDRAKSHQKDYHVTVRAALLLANDSWYMNTPAVIDYLTALLPADCATPLAVLPIAKVAKFAAPDHLANIKTMSSVEIVEVINKLRAPGRAELMHNDFMKKVREHPGINEGNFSGIYSDPLNRNKPCYYLPKREAELMVMSESLDVQTQVYDRLAEFEAKAVPALALPTNYLDALKQLVASVEVTQNQALQITQQAEVIQQANVQIEAAAPAVAFVEKYVGSEGLTTFREVAKILNAPERDFRNFLLDRKYQQRLNGVCMPNKQHENAGRMYVKTRLIDGEARSQCYFTAKGIAWITKLWNERELNPVLRKPLTPPRSVAGY